MLLLWSHLRALCNNKVATLRSAHKQQSTEYLTCDYQVSAESFSAPENRVLVDIVMLPALQTLS